MTRRKIREMAERWAEDEDWDGKPTTELLAAFGTTIARMVRREERDARLAGYEAEERRAPLELPGEPTGVLPPWRRAALERKEHRR